MLKQGTKNDLTLIGVFATGTINFRHFLHKTDHRRGLYFLECIPVHCVLLRGSLVQSVLATDDYPHCLSLSPVLVVVGRA